MILSQAHTLAIEDVLYLEIGAHYLKRCALFGEFFFLSTFIFGGAVGPEQHKILLVWPKWIEMSHLKEFMEMYRA